MRRAHKLNPFRGCPKEEVRDALICGVFLFILIFLISAVSFVADDRINGYQPKGPQYEFEAEQRGE